MNKRFTQDFKAFAMHFDKNTVFFKYVVEIVIDNLTNFGAVELLVSHFVGNFRKYL